VVVADSAADFGNAIVRLLVDDDLRLQTCSKALETAKRHLSAEACYADLLSYLEGHEASP
jgi:glycosyltransferase involved in cell wall biosynthesis